MRALKDNTPCAVLHRARPSVEWELCYYTERISHAWRLQVWISDEESKTNPRQQTVTLLREDYDADRFKVLRVPKDFDPSKVPQAKPTPVPKSYVSPPPPPVPVARSAELVDNPVPIDAADPPELAGAW
jgi:hypothetical protein